MYNTNQTAKKQDRNAARGIAEQAKLQREANARMNKQLDTLETSTPEEEYSSRSGQIRDQLRRKQALALGSIQNTGGGDAVTARADAGKGTAVDYGDMINEALSGMDAPMLQRQGERFMFADTANSLNTLGRHSAQQDYLTRLRGAGIRRNPWLDMLSQAGSAYAGSAAGGFGSGKTMAGSAVPGSTQLPSTFYSSSGAALPGMPGPGGSGRIFSIFGP
jgi:hypothetical protein